MNIGTLIAELSALGNDIGFHRQAEAWLEIQTGEETTARAFIITRIHAGMTQNSDKLAVIDIGKATLTAHPALTTDQP